jgi:RNA polymerase sigma factor (TIGR02999 family)
MDTTNPSGAHQSGLVDDGNTWVNESSAAELIPLMYKELRRAARREHWRFGRDATMQTTVLISESWLRMRDRSDFADRAHFLRAAAQAMRCALIDYARERSSEKRGSGDRAVTLIEDSDAYFNEEQNNEHALIEVGDLLDKLAKLSPRLARVVECRFYAGYTDAETAEALGVTSRTVRRDWIKARAWLRRELERGANT